jgi:hypothetical protein
LIAEQLPLVLTERQRKPCISADCEAVDAVASLTQRVGASAALMPDLPLLLIQNDDKDA